ncbi:MAG: terpene cyclase/mutase family protein [Planctomycetota bacterium]|nr:terpene cyclase/mutase family protein [Planctomycetota bacterium]
MRSLIPVLTALLVLAHPPAARGGEEAPGAAAAQKAAAWMVKHANEDGTIGPGPAAKAPGVVGLCLTGLAMAPGPRSPETQKVLDKAAAYLVALQQADGSFTIPGQGLENYNTSVVIVALKALNDPKYDEVLAKAKTYVLGCQLDESKGYKEDEHYLAFGGFGYGSAKRADLSNTAFSLDALKAMGVEEGSEAYKNALTFIRRCQDNVETNDAPVMKSGESTGGFVYLPGDGEFGTYKTRAGKEAPKPYGNMTYAGIKSLIYCGAKADSPEMQAAWKWIKEHYDATANPGGKGSEGYYYYAVAFAKAFTAAGTLEFTTAEGKKVNWAKDLSGHLAKLQKPDGSFANDEKRWWEADPVLATAYALIALDYCAAAK